MLIVSLLGTDAASAGSEVSLDLAADGVQRGTVILDSYSYSPDRVVAQVGKPVELRLKSVTLLTPHNFIIDDPAAGFLINEDVSAGQDKVVRFVPTRTGSFVFYCDKKLLFFASHREKGMEGTLEVR